MGRLIWRIGLQIDGDRRKTRTMAERSQNLQDLFLNSVRKSKNPLTIFLINGVKLTGVVTSFDRYSGTISTSPPMLMTTAIQMPSQETFFSTVS